MKSIFRVFERNTEWKKVEQKTERSMRAEGFGTVTQAQLFF